MGGFSLGIAIESLVAVLLAVTIGYCVLVNRKLAQLRSDQSELKSIVRALHQATDHASHAIVGLRESAAAADETLGTQLERVKILDKKLTESIGRGDALLAKMAAMPRPADIRHQEKSAPKQHKAPEMAPETRKQPVQPPTPSPSSSRQRSIGLGLLNAQRREAANKSRPGEEAA